MLKNKLVKYTSMSLLLVIGLTMQQSPTIKAVAPTNPILAESSLLLRSSNLSDSWTDGDPWVNEGTGGSDLDAISTGTATNPHNTKTTAEYVPNSGNQSAGIKTAIPLSPPYKSRYGFYIPNSSAFDIPDTTGGLTVTLDLTPEDITDQSRMAWNYANSSLPLSPGGWVMENVPEAVPATPLVTATRDNSNNYGAGLSESMVAGRQRITFRADRDAGSWTLFRNGVVISTNQTLASVESVLSNGELMFGPGWTVHNVAIQNRALSNAEVAQLSSALYSEACVTTPTVNCDVDQDSVNDVVEATAPNNGDGNNDGIADRYQQNVASFVNTTTQAYVTLVVPATTSITSASVVAASTLPVPDTGKTYPLDLANFSMSVASGSTNAIQLYFYTNLQPSQVTPRKYKTATQTYIDIPGNTVQQTSIGGSSALLLSFDITDGGALDNDGVANGVIVDPTGLAVSNNAVSALADTGENMAWLASLAGGLIAFGSVGSWQIYTHKSRRVIRG